MILRFIRSIALFVDMVSMRDLLQLRLDEVQSEAEAMRSYILGAA